jgi:hypothetical protein
MGSARIQVGSLGERLLRRDQEGAVMKSASRTIGAIVGLVTLVCAAPIFAQDWPQWRGADRDGRVTGFAAPQTWPKTLTEKWRKKVGSGDATPALVRDKLYVFARQGEDEVTLCLNAGDGKELWQDKYAAQAVTGAASGAGGDRSRQAAPGAKELPCGGRR